MTHKPISPPPPLVITPLVTYRINSRVTGINTATTSPSPPPPESQPQSQPELELGTDAEEDNNTESSTCTVSSYVTAPILRSSLSLQFAKAGKAGELREVGMVTCAAVGTSKKVSMHPSTATTAAAEMGWSSHATPQKAPRKSAESSIGKSPIAIPSTNLLPRHPQSALIQTRRHWQKHWQHQWDREQLQTRRREQAPCECLQRQGQETWWTSFYASAPNIRVFNRRLDESDWAVVVDVDENDGGGSQMENGGGKRGGRSVYSRDGAGGVGGDAVDDSRENISKPIKNNKQTRMSSNPPPPNLINNPTANLNHKTKKKTQNQEKSSETPRKKNKKNRFGVLLKFLIVGIGGGCFMCFGKLFRRW